MSFDSFELDSALLAGVRDLGFTDPTDIQRDAIPWGLEGRDLLACAMTGSGKTAAFALPILQRLLHRGRGTTRALVLSPTRELALQIEQHFRELAAHTDIRFACVYGGVGYEPQERAFREGYDIIIATPGRLLDILGRPWASLDDVEVLVLDEADRMLDMGFIPDVRRILKQVPARRQTLFFSATLAQPIVRLAGDMLSDPVTINLERRSLPATGVRQAVYPVRHELKPALLLHLLERHDVDSALVFTRTKERADLVGGYLKRAGVKVAVIHGDRTQQHRTRVMGAFKEGKVQVLVATDVAARGIDVEDLSHVINLDVPNQPDDYIHRVGRTARAGATGDALTFVAARELADLHLIEKSIGQKLERVRLDDFDYTRTTAAEPPRRAVAPAGDEAAAAAVAAEPAPNWRPAAPEEEPEAAVYEPQPSFEPEDEPEPRGSAAEEDDREVGDASDDEEAADDVAHDDDGYDERDDESIHDQAEDQVEDGDRGEDRYGDEEPDEDEDLDAEEDFDDDLDDDDSDDDDLDEDDLDDDDSDDDDSDEDLEDYDEDDFEDDDEGDDEGDDENEDEGGGAWSGDEEEPPAAPSPRDERGRRGAAAPSDRVDRFAARRAGRRPGRAAGGAGRRPAGRETPESPRGRGRNREAAPPPSRGRDRETAPRPQSGEDRGAASRPPRDRDRESAPPERERDRGSAPPPRDRDRGSAPPSRGREPREARDGGRDREPARPREVPAPAVSRLPAPEGELAEVLERYAELREWRREHGR
jgi:ATP-dependent RNA helicase RhlE